MIDCCQRPMISRTPRSAARRFAFSLWAACLFAGLIPMQQLQAQAKTERQGYALNWVRAPGAEACISSTELAQRIEQLIGPVLRAPDGADRAIEGLVEPRAAGSGFAVHLRIGDRAGSALGERSFVGDAAACRELDASIVLVLVLTIDPSASERGLPPELLGMLDDRATPAADLLVELEREREHEIERSKRADAEPQPALAPTAPAAPPKPLARAPTPAPTHRQRTTAASTSFELAIAPALSYGIQPEVAPGLGASARLSIGWLAFELGGNLWLPSEITLGDAATPSARIELSAASATLAACLQMARLASLRLAACAGGAFVTRSYARENLINGAGQSSALFGPNASVDGRYALSTKVFAIASAGLLVILPRDRFFYTDGVGDERSAYDPSLLGVTVALGIGARL